MENLFSKCKLAHAKRVLFLKPEDKKIITKEDLKKGIDITKEVKKVRNKSIFFTKNSNDLKTCDIYIVTVPTPVDKKNIPDLKMLRDATRTVGKFLNR